MQLGQPAKNKSRRATTPIILMFPENFSLNSIILDACKQHGFTQPLHAVPANGTFWQTWCYNVWESRFFLNIIQTCLTQLYLQQCHSKTKYSVALSDGLEKNLPVSPAVQAWLSIVRQHFQHIKP